jgi:hypothetical protein
MSENKNWPDTIVFGVPDADPVGLKPTDLDAAAVHGAEGALVPRRSTDIG